MSTAIQWRWFVQPVNFSFGKWLLNDAVMRISNLADQVGIKAIMVHAIDAKARVFYEYFGFVQSPIAANMLFYKL